MGVSLDQILAAREGISGEVVRTPIVPARRLQEQLGCELFLKLESMQTTGSFKDRGALWKLKNLQPGQAERGVIAMSAGNHAQGVAYHAQRLGIPATIVMPEFAPFSKVERTRGFGARVVLTGETLDASAVAARAIAAEEGLTFVHPYDDEFIVAGQGTIGLEILEDQPDLDVIVVPIGGGGIISGIATAIKAKKPEIEIVGVEVSQFPSMYQAIHDLPATSGGVTLADGIAVKNPGELTRAIIKELVSDILLVEEPDVEMAIAYLVEQQKLVAEGAGAAGVAAILAHSHRFEGKKVGTVICGGNIDIRILSGVLNRAMVRDGRMVRLRVEIVDRPNMLSRISQIIGEAGANIIEVYHQRLYPDLPVRQAEIDFILETRNADHVQEIATNLVAAGYPCRTLTQRALDMNA